MWPDYAAENGWEPLGTDSGGTPLRFTLPTPRLGVWYEPEPLGAGVGLLLSSTGFRDGTGTWAARRIADTYQVTLTELTTFDIAFLDSFYAVPTFAPCSVRLTIYDDDRTTVLWQVSTDPASEAPYLMAPGNYAEQEVDVAAGGATIGTVTVGVNDPKTVAGDQDSGWMTARLAWLGLADIAGRRAKLERFTTETTPPVVIADGPAGTVRLADYSRYEFDIRDTRETERKVRLSGGGNNLSLLPFGVADGYGDNGTGGWLMAPTKGTPILGRFDEDPFLDRINWEWDPDVIPAPRRAGRVDLTTDPGNALARLLIPIKAWRESGGLNTISNTGVGEPADLAGSLAGQHRLLWRIALSGSEYTEVEELFLWGGAVVCGGMLGDCPYINYPDDDNPDSIQVNYFAFSGTEDTMPLDTEELEIVILVNRGGISEALPFFLDGVTAGEVARMAYAGELSPRAPDGAIIPTGIRYDAASLTVLDTPVRIRLTAPVADVRSWLEGAIYAPLGYAPALDTFARISPVSQVPPDTASGLMVLHNGIVEPVSDWGSGDRIINVVRFIYQRDFKPGAGPTYGPYPLESRDVIIEYRDKESIQKRHNEHVLEINAAAFRAIGERDGEALPAGQEAETGWLLAEARGTLLLDRYSYGAPSMRFPVLRSATPGLRAGSWVVIDLSWLPDYLTSRRGLLALGQVIALNDLDCEWRQPLVELAGTLDGS